MARRKIAASPGNLLVGDRDPTKPPDYDSHDIMALKALEAGNANEGQQQRALRWIIHGAADTYGLSFRNGGEEGRRATDFAEGRKFVGQQIVKMVNMPGAVLDALRQKEAAAKAAEQPKVKA